MGLGELPKREAWKEGQWEGQEAGPSTTRAAVGVVTDALEELHDMGVERGCRHPRR